MPIDSVLDDIKDGVENIDSAVDAAAVPSSLPQDTNIQQPEIIIPKISLEFIEVVGKLRQLSVIKDSITNYCKITHSAALEVFTMLPNEKNKVPRLTLGASTINKDIVQSVLDSNMDSESVLLEGKEQIQNYVGIANSALIGLEEIKKYTDTLYSLTKDKTEFLIENPPMVIAYRPGATVDNSSKAVDLFKDSIYCTIFPLDADELEYPKYDKVLISKFRNLCYNTDMREISRLAKINYDTMSLFDIITSLQTIQKNMEAMGVETTLRTFIDTSSIVSDTIDDNFLYCVNTANNIATMAEFVTKVKSIIDTENNCLDNAVEVLNML